MRDEHILAEANGRLTAEVAQLQREKRMLSDRVDNLTWKLGAFKWANELPYVLFWICLSAVVAGSGVCIYKGIATPHTITHCYIKSWLNVERHAKWTLYGSIEWGRDDDLGDFSSLDDTIAAAEKLNCPLQFSGPR